MASIRTTAEEMGDIVIYMLLESLKNEDMLLANPRYQELLKYLKLRNMEGILLRLFLEMDTNTRIKYKRVRKTFTEGEKNTIFMASQETAEEPVEVSESMAQFDRELCKRIFRKVKEVRFKTSQPITEERLDKIIDYCIKEHEKYNGGNTNG